VIAADTNVVSELMRDEPAPSVLAWARGLGPGEATITVVTVEEIERGLALLPSGRRRRDLTERWQRVLDAYADTLLVYDAPAAQATAAILVERRRAGLGMSLADAQIAGICSSQRAVLATRNTKDFAGVAGLDVINPF
jgi:predicted nucleic acid-binding protein